jgi:hypothetical protein
MKTKLLSEKFPYTGGELRPLWNYLEHGLLGDSAVAWVGPCQISASQMKDGEDLRDQAQICGDEMLHVMIEVFDIPLIAGVLLQRLLASIAKDLIDQAMGQPRLRRCGDDLFLNHRKLSISVAVPCARSTLVHFAVNLTNSGTPIQTACLADLNISPQPFAESLLFHLSREWQSCKEATWKVLEG